MHEMRLQLTTDESHRFSEMTDALSLLDWPGLVGLSDRLSKVKTPEGDSEVLVTLNRKEIQDIAILLFFAGAAGEFFGEHPQPVVKGKSRG